MRTVIVNIPEVHMSYLTLEVGDDIPDYEIKEKANDMLEAGDYKDALEYSHTMDMAMWDITDDTTVTCKCGNDCEASSKDTDCPCFNIPNQFPIVTNCCLQGECECECAS